ncbi:MAG: family 20 glycosylhydrolase [Planctomycetota bacterium]
MILAPTPRHLETTGGRCPLATLEAEVSVNASATPHAQGYTLTLLPDAVRIEAHDEAGAFYAQQTLIQMRRQVDDVGGVPCTRIEDWPDFATRGLMLDISRDRVPTMATLFGFIDGLAQLKINQLQLYTEHTFAYVGHEPVWEHASPVTPEEIRELDAYCQARFIELVPNQNCFGHMERWLKHVPYRGLAECPDGFVRDDLPEPFFSPEAKTLNPLDPGSLALVEDLLGQLLPCFASGSVNVGCDETFDLGKGKSKAVCEKRGKGRVYLDFVKKVHRVCEKHGRTVQFWGDIVLHYPELLPEVKAELPGAVALTWGYELDHPFEKETQAFADAGLDYVVCPSTASFVGIGGRSDVAVGNAFKAAEAGLNHGASGLLNTWWGDFGHWQPWAVNSPGIVAGASSSWCGASNRELDVAAALDTLVFSDASARLGESVMELGRLRDDLKCNRDNALGWALIRDEADFVDGQLRLPWGPTGPITTEMLDAAQARIERATAGFALADPKRSDGALLLEELRIAARMLTHSAENLKARIASGTPHSRGLPHAAKRKLHDDAADWLPAYCAAWQRRSRPGGMADSTAAIERLMGYYQT